MYMVGPSIVAYDSWRRVHAGAQVILILLDCNTLRASWATWKEQCGVLCSIIDLSVGLFSVDAERHKPKKVHGAAGILVDREWEGSRLNGRRRWER
jgi:hypothetical protein